MAWNEVEPMEERVRFVLMVQEGLKNFADACRHFEISRKTGYKWWRRYQRGGLFALEERVSRPLHSPKATSEAWREKVVSLRKERPHWGPKKLRSRLLLTTSDGSVPASSTIGRILAAAGLVKRGRKRRPPGPVVIRTGLTQALLPNDVWAVDYKGWFRLGNGERCEPLTVSDLFSRYVLCCFGLPNVSYEHALPVFQKLFKEKGQPLKIRVDNGPPFGSRGAAGLSRLAVWWVSLGIGVEFIDPGHPEQNGSHERMHRTLKAEGLSPIAHHRKAQQERMDRWRWEFNYERPHEALRMVTPASVYQKSTRCYLGPTVADYAPDYVLRRVRTSGEINWAGRKRFIGEAFIGQTLGVLKKDVGKHHVYFHHYLLGEIEESEEMGMKPVITIGRHDGGSAQK
jgi:transposase InsO family protein